MSEYKIKFKIGEFSRLNRVTVKTLRYYEEIGLLVPYETDEWTGYRYYSVEQFQQVNTIIYLKQLGFSLEEIRDLFATGRHTPSLAAIEAKIRQCEGEQKQLQRRYNELNSLAKSLQKKKNGKSIYQIASGHYRSQSSSYHQRIPGIIRSLPENYRSGNGTTGMHLSGAGLLLYHRTQ